MTSISFCREDQQHWSPPCTRTLARLYSTGHCSAHARFFPTHTLRSFPIVSVPQHARCRCENHGAVHPSHRNSVACARAINQPNNLYAHVIGTHTDPVTWALSSRVGAGARAVVRRAGARSWSLCTRGTSRTRVQSNGNFGRALTKLSVENSGPSPRCFGRSRQPLKSRQLQTQTNERPRDGSQASLNRQPSSLRPSSWRSQSEGRGMGQKESWARQGDMYRGVRRRGEGRVPPKLEIPPSVLADRDRRLHLRPRDVSAALCGDPLPGRSALERGPDPRPFRRTDVLDGLRFPG